MLSLPGAFPEAGCPWPCSGCLGWASVWWACPQWLSLLKQRLCSFWNRNRNSAPHICLLLTAAAPLVGLTGAVLLRVGPKLENRSQSRVGLWTCIWFLIIKEVRKAEFVLELKFQKSFFGDTINMSPPREIFI